MLDQTFIHIKRKLHQVSEHFLLYKEFMRKKVLWKSENKQERVLPIYATFLIYIDTIA